MVVGYVRVSTIKQDTDMQKGEIDRWSNYHTLPIDSYVAETISSRKSDREIFNLIDIMGSGDVLVVTELSRLARSVKELLFITDKLIAKKVRIVFLKEALDINDENPAGKMMLSILGAIAEFERSMISLRTKESIQTRRDNGASVGRVKGSKNKEHKLLGKEKQIREYLDKGMNKTDIMKLLDVSRGTFYAFVSEMGL